MTRVFLCITCLVIVSLEALGQCVNGPTVTLQSTTANTCGLLPVTLTGNSFGGSATLVTITVNGRGTITPTSASVSPFSFTYTPASGDLGKQITVTVTTNNPKGPPCSAAKATCTISVYTNPTAPVVGTITNPTCQVSTGSVVLSGLPSAGTWTLTRSPGAVATTGTGTTSTVSGIPPGTYTFVVSSSSGCNSPASSNVVIAAQPVSPPVPVQTVDCSLGAGKATVTVSSPTGSGFTYSLDAGTYQSGTLFINVSNGNHSITVRNSSGCTTTGSIFQVSCGCANPPTVTLSSTAGTTCATNSVIVSGNTFGGSATNVTISENGMGTVSPASSGTKPFSFTYTPAAGDVGKTVLITVTTNNPMGSPCISATATYSLSVIDNPSAPVVGTITQPVCSGSTGSVILSGLPSTGTWTITRSPGGITSTGTGNSTTYTGLPSGTYTFTVTNSSGCISGSSDNVVINQPGPNPSAPVVGTIIQPNCTVSTGSIILNGLPSTGTWTLTRSPGGAITTGSGTTIAISNLTEGTYSYTVSNSSGCTSTSSENIVIIPQPSIPAPPQIGTITTPTCMIPSGSVALSGLPATGTWTVTRYPGTITSSGTGTTTVITGLPGGVYNFTVSNEAGCVSSMSTNVTIPTQPFTPTPPVIGTITQPAGDQQTGSVVINGLPATGNWTLTLSPGNTTVIGSGSTKTIMGLAPGTYSLTVTNSLGCTSVPSASFEIIQVTDIPVLVINNPPPVCSPLKVDITSPDITSGSSSGLVFTYWTDAACTLPFLAPTSAPAGIYYIKGTAANSLSSVKPVTVTVYKIPVANAGADQVLAHKFETTMDAQVKQSYETGIWSLISGTGELFEPTNPKTSVSGLTMGKNVFLWTVSNGVCPTASDTVNILVHGLAYQTLITPNMDGKNDYFILKGLDTEGKLSLIIFDRRGALVYKNLNYDNTWNGVDYNGRILPDDTYFYILKTDSGLTEKGYIVVRR